MTRYLVWKDPECNGENVEWIELSAEKFFKLCHSPEGAQRKFIELRPLYNGDDHLFIEANDQIYKEWKRECNHEQYIKHSEKEAGYKTVSLNAEFDDDDICIMEKISYNEESVSDIVEKIVLLDMLKTAKKSLSSNEIKLLDYYINNSHISDTQIAKALAIPKTTLSYRKQKLINSLSALLGEKSETD